MIKTNSRDYFVKEKMILRGFPIKIQGLKHNYKYKLEDFGAKMVGFGLRVNHL
jgi:hypothetical protein